MKRIFHLKILMLMILVLSSCTKEAVEFKEELSTPAKTYKFWLEAGDKGDVEGSMKCLTEASKRIMDEQSRFMGEFMARLKDNLKVFKTYSIVEQKSKGDRGVVVLKGEKGDLMVIPFKKEADGWKVDLISLLGGAG